MQQTKDEEEPREMAKAIETERNRYKTALETIIAIGTSRPYGKLSAQAMLREATAAIRKNKSV